VYPAMTGITRFLYENEELGWKYNRTEHLTDKDLLVFTHLFSDRKEIEGFKLYKKPWKAFDSLNLKQYLKNPLNFTNILRLEDMLFILEREDLNKERVK
jgi:hypothetical protein